MTAAIILDVRSLELKGNVLLMEIEGGGEADGRQGTVSVIYDDGAPRGVGYEVLFVVGSSGQGIAVAGAQGFVLAGVIKPPVYNAWPRRNGHQRP